MHGINLALNNSGGTHLLDTFCDMESAMLV